MPFFLINNILIPLWETVGSFYNLTKKTFNYLFDLSCGHYHEWHFIDDCSPIFRPYINDASPSNVKWIYNVDSRTLNLNQHELTFFSSLPWLSANIIHNKNSYSMDEWLQDFKYDTDSVELPTPMLIVSLWSLSTGIWFSNKDNNVKISFVLEDGNEYSLGLNDIWKEDFLFNESDLDSESLDEDSVAEEQLPCENGLVTEGTDIECTSSQAQVQAIKSTATLTDPAVVEPPQSDDTLSASIENILSGVDKVTKAYTERLTVSDFRHRQGSFME